MKKKLDAELTLGDMKRAITDFHHQENKKTAYFFVGVIVTLLVATIIAIAWFVNRKNEDSIDEDWDDWEVEDSEDMNEDGCCCDKDFDKSVTVKQL